MYVDYEFYETTYFGNVINETEFPRYESKASDKLYSFTMGKIDKYLVEDSDGDMVLDESKISFNIKKSICAIAEIIYDIEKANDTYRKSVGLETDNGMLKGKVVSSVSAGAENIKYSTSISDESNLSDVIKSSKTNQEKYMFDSVRDYLGWTGLLSQAL